MIAIRLAVLAMGIGGMLLADEPGSRITTTQHLTLPAGGAVHVTKWSGEVEVEAWDQPDVELTAVIATPPGEDEYSKPRLQLTHIAMTRHGNELVIATTKGHGAGHPAVDYKIRAPRNARLVVDRGSGEVHMTGLSGDIRAAVRRGEIVLLLPQDAHYAIDAKSDMGNVVSDFAGPAGAASRRHPWIFGHGFTAAAQGPAAHTLYLRAGFGDLLILKDIHPVRPGPLNR